MFGWWTLLAPACCHLSNACCECVHIIFFLTQVCLDTCMCRQTCFPVSQESAHYVKSPGEQHTPTEDPDIIPEMVSSPSHTAVQSGTGSWDLVWYADWAQGTAMWQWSMLFDGSLFIVLCSHVFIQLIQLIPDDLSLTPPAYMSLFRQGLFGLIREHSQIIPDCSEALIDERENISLQIIRWWVWICMLSGWQAFCWHPALPQEELCCLLFIKQPRWCFQIAYSLLIGSSRPKEQCEWGSVHVCVCISVCVWHEGDFLCVCAHFTGVKLTPAEEEDLRKRWQHAVGPRYEVLVRR